MIYTNKIVSVAPMMDWTDRHCRMFYRALSKKAVLYTEMVTAQAVIHGDRDKLLGFNPEELPLVLQLGGSDPQLLAKAARIGADYGYSAINLNIGCPSDRVQQGRFGACLMMEPELVAECVSAMAAAVDIPVTVKCRIGVDDQDVEGDLHRFITVVSEAACSTFIAHARKAWLKGLSPKENREIPPLDYDRVHRLKASFPHLNIHLNGGLTEPVTDAAQHLVDLDGLMYGRAAYHTPWMLTELDQLADCQSSSPTDRFAVIQSLEPYIAHSLQQGGRLHQITRHMIGLFHGQVGGKKWRQILSASAHDTAQGLDRLNLAVAAVHAEQDRKQQNPNFNEA